MDYGDENNPFAEPNARKATTPNNSNPSSNDNNPFGNPTIPAQPIPVARQPSTTPYLPSPQPPPTYTPAPTPVPPPATTRVDLGDYDRREADLTEREKRLAERERSLTNQTTSGQPVKNFPPLPKFFPCGPCFYQDISAEIPAQFQTRVRFVFYLWLAYIVTLFLNMIGALSFMLIDWTDGAITFGLSIVYLLLFLPLSYIFWFRSIYRAFKTDSSVYFMIFFFIDFTFFFTNVLFATGFVPGMCGFYRISLISKNAVVGTMMIVLGILWSIICVITAVLTVMIHRLYRQTGASLDKAQQEFQTTLANNETVHGAARDIARAGINEALRTNDDRPIY